MQVKDLTTDELKALIRETVFAAIAELLPDPDSGLAIKPEFEQSLLEIRSRRETNTVGISAQEVADRLGLNC
jgi:hypothetical protein